MSPRKKASCPTYYVGESESINGRSRIIRQTYLGTAWLVRDKASAVPFQARLAANGIRFRVQGEFRRSGRFFALQAVVAVAVALLDLHLLAGFRERRGKEQFGRWRSASALGVTVTV